MAVVPGADTVEVVQTLWDHGLQNIGQVGDTAAEEKTRDIVMIQSIVYLPHSCQIMLSRCFIQPAIHQHMVSEGTR